MVLTLINTELLKLRTVRWPWVLLAVQVGLVILAVVGYSASRGDNPIDPKMALAHVGLTSLIALVLGTMAVAGEYRDGTITDTFLATPRRERVIAAKLVTFTVLGLVFATITGVVGVAVTAAAMSSKGASLDPGSAAVWQTVGGAILWNGAFAAVGVGLGALFRNLTAAIVVGLAWIALVEGLVAQLVGTDLGRWLPMYAGSALEGMPGKELLAPWGGGIVLAIYAAVFGLVAAVATVRGDVT